MQILGKGKIPKFVECEKIADEMLEKLSINKQTKKSRENSSKDTRGKGSESAANDGQHPI